VGAAIPTIRDILNKIKWSLDGGLSDCEIVIEHRGAPGNLKVIKGGNIRDIAPRALIVQEEGEEVIIPFHRIREIRKGKAVLWSKKN